MTTQPVSSSSFTHDSSWTYDVFLSFRGKDTRTNFTDHLYKALCDKDINTFIDRELVRGEEISPALVKAIEESRISLIVFSEKYASSRWCLDELVKILQCKQSKQQIVLPIFYKVDPSDVENQTNSFGYAFEELIESKFKDNEEKVLIWREALKKAAKLSGYPFKDGEYETTCINNIVDGILSRVPRSTYLYVAKHPVGIQSPVRDVERLLDVGGNDRRMVRIWGTSRIGKKTIAKVILNAVSHKFEGSCFLKNVKEESLVQLQKTSVVKGMLSRASERALERGGRKTPEAVSCFASCTFRAGKATTRKHLPNLTYMNLSGCQFLEKIPDLSGIPNIEYLILSGCTRLVEVDKSIGFLDKLVELDLGGCFNLTKFARRLRLKSLETLILWGCKRLESFPEIEVRMESLWGLYMQQSGIIEFPASIQYLTELRHLDLAGCFNLTKFPTLRLESLQVLDLKDCKRLESFPKFELLSTWSTLRELNLSGTNFVTLPECISKFVSLEVLFLRDCGSLLEIPQEVLPPRVGRVFLDNCTSLEKFPKLPLSSEVEDKELSLINCVRLHGYDITENIFLDQVSSPHSQFQITLPGDEVPKWFRCCKDVTLVERSFGCNGRCEVCFQIPPNLDWETLRLVLCVVNKGNAYVHLGGAETRVHINRKMVQSTFVEATETHVSLNCIPLLNPSELGVGEELTRLQKGNMCQIIFEFYDMPTPVKILCGVHLLGHQVADHGPT